MQMENWLLPDGIRDVLPKDSDILEKLRRIAIDRMQSYGYQLVAPPMVEYLESMVEGVGKDLELQTFKLIDQISGRTLGVRADFTPQVARIDSQRLNTDGISRLCYASHVAESPMELILEVRYAWH